MTIQAYQIEFEIVFTIRKSDRRFCYFRASNVLSKMNWIGVLISINILIFSVIFVQLTSSASFPNPPQRPPSDASPDEQALFWKLLHNYYAIIARPR
jgi:hypothetical protein